MPSRIRAARTTVPLLALALLLAACDDNGDTASAEGSDEHGTFAELLRLLPDDPVIRASLSMGDVARTRGVLGVERPHLDPDDELDHAAVIEYFTARGRDVPEGFRGAPPFLFEPRANRLEPDVMRQMHEALALSPLDVDQWVNTGIPPRRLSLIRGHFDVDLIDARINACAACPPAHVEDRGPARIYAWGRDLEMDRDGPHPPLFDDLGRGGRLAVADRWIAQAYYTDGVRAVVDAYEGTNSLGDDEDFRLAAAGMDHLAALTAFLTDEFAGPDGPPQSLRSNRPEVAAAWTPEPGDTLLRPYLVAAIGPGWEDGQPYTAVVLVHESDDEARENADRLAERLASARYAWQVIEGETWADVFEDIEVEVDGRVLRAKLHGFALAPLGFGGVNILLMEPILQHE